MELEVGIKGKLVIADDELAYLQAQGVEEVATALIRYGKDIKISIAEILAEGKSAPMSMRREKPKKKLKRR